MSDKEELWLPIAKYAQKYGLPTRRLKGWIHRGWVEAEKRKTPHTSPTIAKGKLIDMYWVLDLPYWEHPSWKEKARMSEGEKIRRVPPLTKQAGKLRKYYDKFVQNVPPDQVYFTSADLYHYLDIEYNTLQRWEKWGLKKLKIKDTFNYKEHVKGRKNEVYCYYRPDIVNFLLQRDETQPGTLDALGREKIASNVVPDGYFDWEVHKKFPWSKEGWLAWLDYYDVHFLDRSDGKIKKYIPWENHLEAAEGVFDVDEWGCPTKKLVVLCWPRGEGKSLVVAMFVLFRFFNKLGEKIVLSGNSRDQAKFAHFDICMEILNNTPKLKTISGLHIKEKFIALLKGPKDKVNEIIAVPTSSGLYSNTTCAVFTEFQDLQDRPFFSKLHSSLRGMKEAQTYIDCCVAPKDHPIAEMYETSLKGTDPKLFFHYYADKHYNPNMTEAELTHIKSTVTQQEYNRYFRNRWEDASGAIFDDYDIEMINILGCDGNIGIDFDTSEIVKELVELRYRLDKLKRANVNPKSYKKRRDELEKRLRRVDTIYKLPANIEDIHKICELFNVESMIIGVGLDRASAFSREPDRSVLTCVGRVVIDMDMSYYFLLDMVVSQSFSLSMFVDKMNYYMGEYGWIDRVILEKYQTEDLVHWCIENGLVVDHMEASYKVQFTNFSRLEHVIKNGQYKAPLINIIRNDDGTLFKAEPTEGVKDIHREELGVFVHEYRQNQFGMITNGWFGSPYKRKRGGIKDDTVYSVAMAITATQIDEAETLPKASLLKALAPAIYDYTNVGSY